jgi:hypothetical protein
MTESTNVREYHHDGRNTLPILGDSRESVSSPPKNDISALEAFKKGNGYTATSRSLYTYINIPIF